MAEATTSDEPDLNTFENKSGLAEDMKFLASMPELCDVTFLVGDTREPVCAVKAVLAARSRRVFFSGHYCFQFINRVKHASSISFYFVGLQGISQDVVSSAESSKKKGAGSKGE